MLRPGTKAPEIDLPDQHGERFRLSALSGRKNVVVYFYPKDDTPVCTAEACGFRDKYERFKDKDTEVIGISKDDMGSHGRFAARHSLPFPLLTDATGEVHKAYDVGSFLVLWQQRITYVVGKDGIIRGATKAMFDADRHVEEALRSLP
ncbi:MAG: peroxiredoxin [Flavobacteriales bacterium]|nr:peroxiredoxin [Flavobacteriales bacterium]